MTIILNTDTNEFIDIVIKSNNYDEIPVKGIAYISYSSYIKACLRLEKRNYLTQITETKYRLTYDGDEYIRKNPEKLSKYKEGENGKWEASDLARPSMFLNNVEYEKHLRTINHILSGSYWMIEGYPYTSTIAIEEHPKPINNIGGKDIIATAHIQTGLKIEKNDCLHFESDTKPFYINSSPRNSMDSSNRSIYPMYFRVVDVTYKDTSTELFLSDYFSTQST